MTKQSQITEPAAFLAVRSRHEQAIESMTQHQPDSELTPFTRDTHQGIMIEWGPYVLTYGRPNGDMRGRSC